MQFEGITAATMEPHPNYSALVALLNQSLANPTPENELKLTQLPPQTHFAVISNPQ